MLCRRITFLTRTGLYMFFSAKDRPPLLRYSQHNITAINARKLVRTTHEGMVSSLNCLQQVIDPSLKPRLARYLLDVKRVKKSTPIGKCSDDESTVANDLLLEVIVDENMPFSIFDSKKSILRPFKRFLSHLCHGYKLPSSHHIRTKLLDAYYIDLKQDVLSKLRMLLQECRATVMFDGSEDVNDCPMVNVLLRVMGNSRIRTSTCVLTTVYTGYDTVNVDYYLKMTENELEDFGGFKYVTGVVTDNTGSVKNAREILESKYPRLVASQDQAHVADRLMADFGKLPWIRDIHEKLSTISSILKRYRKIRAKMMEFIKQNNAASRLSEPEEYSSNANHDLVANVGIKEVGASESNGGREEEETDLVQLRQFEYENDDYLMNEDVEKGLTEGIMGEVISQSPSSLRQHPNISHPVIRTAVTMKKPSAVRFASSEKLLEEYVRLRPVATDF